MDTARRHTTTDLDGQKLTESRTVSQILNCPPNENRTSSQASVQNKASKSRLSLSIELARQNLSGLGPGLFYQNLDLHGQGLEVIGANILNFKLICNLDVSQNSLQKLGSHISKLSNLTTLNASSNKLTAAFDFGTGCRLHSVDYSSNQIEDIDAARSHRQMRTLNLSDNKITDVRGLSQCRQLRKLVLRNNEIRSADGLQNLPVVDLDLQGNKMEDFTGVSHMTKLLTLNANKNQISSLALFENSSSPIQELNIADNKISQMADILPLQNLKFLHKLDLRGNPLCKLDDYRDLVVFLLPRITVLDGEPVHPEDTVRARNLFRPNADLCAALDHMTHTVYGVLEGDHIREYTMPSLEHPYPILILTGAPKMQKAHLVARLSAEFGNSFAQAVSHTTRKPKENESNGEQYHFVDDDQFQELIRRGAFIQMSRQRGNSLFGLTKDALEVVAMDGKAALAHVNLDGVRTLKLTHLKPRFMLILPSSPEIYENMLHTCDLTPEEKSEAWEEYEELCRINREKPGYFDMVISSDSTEAAYESLRQLVVEFLGEERLNSRMTKSRESRDSEHCTSTPQSRQRRAEDLLEAIRHTTPNIQVHSAPARCISDNDGLLQEILDHEVYQAENSSDDDWSSVSSSLNATPVLPPLLPQK